MRQNIFGSVFAGRLARSRRGWVGLVPVLVGMAVAGCSADIIRLDSPSSFSLNDSPSSAMSRPAAAMSRSSVGLGSASGTTAVAGDTYTQPTATGNAGSGVKMAALPDATAAPNYASAPPEAQSAAVQSSAKSGVRAQPAGTQPVTEKGEAIQVKTGDTLYGLSKRHHASIAELMSINALSSPNLKPGQTLYLPVGKNASKKPLVRPAEVAAATPTANPTAQQLTPPSAAQLAKYDGTYTVKKGDSLYALAIQMKVPMNELAQVNAIADVRKVRPGAILKVPAAAVANAAPGTASVAAADTETAAKLPPAVVQSEAARTVPSTTQPVIINSKKVAAVEQPSAETPAPDAAAATQPAASATPASSATAPMGKLRWPAKGKVIGSFGPRPDGTHNDGVNLSVPLGTEVHAAEAGTVAYAGSELKGYGNLILLRHDNGWITAYAHNEELLAKRGDKVKRGQVLAKAGKSGQVDQPQVHFELRQGSKPVDPTPFMEKL